MIGLRMVKKNYDNMLIRFHPIPERHRRTDRQTDRRTDGQNCNIDIARQCDHRRPINGCDYFWQSFFVLLSYQTLVSTITFQTL